MFYLLGFGLCVGFFVGKIWRLFSGGRPPAILTDEAYGARIIERHQASRKVTSSPAFAGAMQGVAKWK